MENKDSRHFFTKCEIALRSEIEFNKFGNKIQLPFYFHIKDVENDLLYGNEEELVEDYTIDVFYNQRDGSDTREKYIHLLKHVELKDFTMVFDEDDREEYKDMIVEYKNDYIFKNHESLYSFLVEALKFNDVDFYQIDMFILRSKFKLRETFEKMLCKELAIGDTTEKATESFMVLRCAFELTKPPLFKENIGKSISEMSYRELLTQRAYMGRKCDIEQKQHERIMNESKNKK